MTAFATHSDFASRLGVDLTVAEQTDATTLLELASDIIRDETGQTISRVDDDEFTIRSVYGNRIALPQRPVIEISSVAVGSTAVTDWYLDGSELVRGRILAANGPSDYDIGWQGPTYP